MKKPYGFKKILFGRNGTVIICYKKEAPPPLTTFPTFFQSTSLIGIRLLF